MLEIVFRTDNPPYWTGPNVRLTKMQADQNMFNIKTAIEELQADRPQPNNIASITSTGLSWTVTFQDATEIEVPVQVLQWRSRGEWLPSTSYQAFDGFTVEATGSLYSVNITHISDTSFDENRLIGGLPVYNKIVGKFDTSQSSVYDIVIYYPGVLADLPSDVPLYEERALRKYILRAAPADLHSAYLDEPPSVATQNLPVFSGATEVGTITVAVGENVGLVTFIADVTIERFGILSIGKPGTADPVAAGLSIGFAAERTI